MRQRDTKDTWRIGLVTLVCLVAVLSTCIGSANAAIDEDLPPREPNSERARCFMRNYNMQLQTNYTAATVFRTLIDTLVPVPLMITFNSIRLSPVIADRCTSYMSADPLRFTWSADPDYEAPFNLMRVGCGSRKPLDFGISTLGNRVWGSKARSIVDGSIFATQNGRVSFLTGTYNEYQTPSRLRDMSIKMTSSRTFERYLSVSVCVLASEVPYDLPSDMNEISAPPLLPLISCVRESGGRCGANLGYVNSLPTPIDMRFGGALNKFVPSSLLNGITMPSTFYPGVHWPWDFTPTLHVSWLCEMDTVPEDSAWRLDGYALRLRLLETRCSADMAFVTSNGLIVSETDEQQQLDMRNAQDLEPFIKSILKPIPERTTFRVKSFGHAEKYWHHYGADVWMSTVSRDAHAAAERLAYEGQYAESTAVRAQYAPTKYDDDDDDDDGNSDSPQRKRRTVANSSKYF